MNDQMTREAGAAGVETSDGQDDPARLGAGRHSRTLMRRGRVADFMVCGSRWRRPAMRRVCR